MLPLEFVVLGTPLSLQASSQRKAAWKTTVAQAAATGIPANTHPIADEVTVEITYFFDTVGPDIDNIIKPILDALNNVVWVDDSQVSRTTSQRKSLDASYRVRGLSAELARGFVSGGDFVHIRITDAPPVGVLP